MRPQKKQGTARMGNKRPPHFRGGGRVFGPIPRDHSFDLPRKGIPLHFNFEIKTQFLNATPPVVKFGLRVGLSTKFLQNQMTVVDFSTLDSHKVFFGERWEETLSDSN